jgi:hypothetical protein
MQADGTREVSAQHSPDDDAKKGGDDAPVEAWHELKSPVDFSKTVGRIRVQTQSATLQVSVVFGLVMADAPKVWDRFCAKFVKEAGEQAEGECTVCYSLHAHAASCSLCLLHLAQHLEKQFWGRALKIADLNADGTLELHEFSLLMKARPHHSLPSLPDTPWTSRQ